jgi:predicted PurR-regulated permease PerM
MQDVGRLGRTWLAVLLAFAALGLLGWGTTRQLSQVVQELPMYRQNIRQKIRDVRHAGDGSVGALQNAIEDIRKEIDPASPAGTPAQVVQDEAVSGLWRFPVTLGPMLEPLAAAGLVIVLVVFMLLERQDLRDRLIRLFGHGQLTVTTRAFDEAGRRVSRYLLIQSLINLAYGADVGLGLWAIGVPYPVLWGFLGAALRFIPYVGSRGRRRGATAGGPRRARGVDSTAPRRGAVPRSRAVHESRPRDRLLRGGRPASRRWAS